jgi:hypothetical protein
MGAKRGRRCPTPFGSPCSSCSAPATSSPEGSSGTHGSASGSGDDSRFSITPSTSGAPSARPIPRCRPPRRLRGRRCRVCLANERRGADTRRRRHRAAGNDLGQLDRLRRADQQRVPPTSRRRHPARRRASASALATLSPPPRRSRCHRVLPPRHRGDVRLAAIAAAALRHLSAFLGPSLGVRTLAVTGHGFPPKIRRSSCFRTTSMSKQSARRDVLIVSLGTGSERGGDPRPAQHRGESLRPDEYRASRPRRAGRLRVASPVRGCREPPGWR